ncbi:MAG: NHLP bacteriocin export ABC transporter permease/ATPase subunit [Planctomycetota bacterium]|jgi:NHLM bacteriocin system ABC transporter ATP-binding protein
MAACLSDFFATHGSSAATSGSDPVPLLDPDSVWLVNSGHVDLVAVTITQRGDVPAVERTHLMRIEPGQLIFGFQPLPASQEALLLAYGAPGSQVTRLPVTQVAEAGSDPALADEVRRLVDEWVESLCALCSAGRSPRALQHVRPGSDVALEAGQSAQPQAGVLWFRPLDGAVRFLGEDGANLVTGDGLMPVGKDAWLTADGPCRLRAMAAADIDLNDGYWRGLNAFQDTVGSLIEIQRREARRNTRYRLLAKTTADRSVMATALSELGSILRPTPTAHHATGTESDLLAACRLVSEAMGIDIPDQESDDREADTSNPLESIAARGRFALRRARLKGDWWRRDGGPLLGFMNGGELPVALLPTSSRQYELHDVGAGFVTPVTEDVARRLDPVAFRFYRCLPDRPLRLLDLVRFAAQGVQRDARTIVLAGAISGIVMLLLPIAIGHVFDALIPHAARLQLLQITVALLVAAMSIAAFEMTRNVALIRLKHRSGDALQAAVWERVLNLPARFFTRYTAGDLGVRAMGVESIMQVLSTAAITTALSGVFSLLAIVLLFIYSPSMAVVCVGLVLMVLAVFAIAGLFQVRFQRVIEDQHGRMSGLLLQFIIGIPKMRVAAAEPRAFAQWSARFAEQTRMKIGSRIVTNNLDVFLAAYPVLTFLVIFLLMARQSSGAGELSTGAFLAFVAAFGALLTGMIQLGTTFVDLVSVVPIYERLQPILQAEPEVSQVRTNPGPLRGRIEVSHVSFRYETDGPPILSDVSFVTEPGEFVALVGPSGSGKSTLLRVLLGFEQPEAGTVAYDGFDVAGIDPRALRRQLGVVLQNGALLPGDLFTNIVGSAVDLTLDDAWQAARRAGLARDIEQMPMGMHTVLTEGASTLSGGQRQRLMIARALVTDPRVVFFDEATSALDNPTQAIVTESLDQMRATRIVIAHRLSTIVRADRIYVLEGGRIVQAGGYDELVGRPGLFLDLVKRQMA